MDLAGAMIAATMAVFFVGALVALIWSTRAGHWKHLDEASLVVLDEDDPPRVPKDPSLPVTRGV